MVGKVGLYKNRKDPLLTLPARALSQASGLAKGKPCFATLGGVVPRILLFPPDEKLIQDCSDCREALRKSPLSWEEADEGYADWPRSLRRFYTLPIWRDGRVELPTLLASLADIPWKDPDCEVVVCNLGPTIIEVYASADYRKEEERLREGGKHRRLALEIEFRERSETNH